MMNQSLPPNSLGVEPFSLQPERRQRGFLAEDVAGSVAEFRARDGVVADDVPGEGGEFDLGHQKTLMGGLQELRRSLGRWRQVRRWRRYLAEERFEETTYRRLAERRKGEDRRILHGLADAEKRHQQHWINLLGPLAWPAPRVPLLTRLLGELSHAFGSVFVLALAQRSEQRSCYDTDADATEQMAADERIHGEVVRALASKSRQSMSGMFRAGVFGVNDGLVSNLALTVGVAATGTSHSMVLTTGFAGLLAGALSMAVGEYISVTSQRELLAANQTSPALGRAVAALDLDSNELALLFRARGYDQAAAQVLADQVLSSFHEAYFSTPGTSTALFSPSRLENRAIDVPGGGGVAGERDILRELSPTSAGAADNLDSLNTLAGTGQGTPPEVGTPLSAATSSFSFFAAGALLPLLPFLVGLAGTAGIIGAAALVGAALLLTGGVVGVLSGNPPLPRALRQLMLGFLAAAMTYLLGLVFGASAL